MGVARGYASDPCAVEIEAGSVGAVDGQEWSLSPLCGVVAYAVVGFRVRDDAPVVVARSLVFDGEIIEVEVVVVCEFDSIFAVVELGGGLVF